MGIITNLIKKIPADYQQIIFRNYLMKHYKRRASDFRYAIVPDDYVGKLILVNGSYEGETIRFIKKYQKELFETQNTFWDIGGNYGVYSVELHQLFNRIETFEPNLSVSNLLRANLGFNKIKNVTVHDIGLGAEDQTVPFYVADTNLGESSTILREHTTDKPKEPSFNIVVKKGDGLEEELKEGLSFVKIDVEEQESFVIAGLKNTLQQYKPLILMEVVGRIQNFDQEFYQRMKMLKELGYDHYYITSKSKAKELIINHREQTANSSKLGKSNMFFSTKQLPELAQFAVKVTEIE